MPDATLSRLISLQIVSDLLPGAHPAIVGYDASRWPASLQAASRLRQDRQARGIAQVAGIARRNFAQNTAQILPERVLGRESVQCSTSGVAAGQSLYAPSCGLLRTVLVTFLPVIKRDVGVDRLTFNIVRIPTTAASAIFGCATSADSILPSPGGDRRRSARRPRAR